MTWLAAILPALLAGALTTPSVTERALTELAPQIRASVPYSLVEDAIELPVERSAFLMLPLPGATELELELESDATFLVSWMTETTRDGPPWRYRRVDAGKTRLHVDLRQTNHFLPQSSPILRFDGAGKLRLRKLRSSSLPADPRAAHAEIDRAQLLAPESLSHSVINSLLPPRTSATEERYLPPLLAAGAALLGLGAWLWLRRAGGARAGLRALGISALASVLAYNAFFVVVRFGPVVHAPIADREARLRRNYYFAPQVGELAALARAALPMGARIGVLTSDDDWFTAEALCFNLMPRRCVRLAKEGAAHVAPAGGAELRADELDYVLFYDAERPLPEGFLPQRGVGPRAFIARRAPGGARP